MEIYQIIHFIAIVETGSFTKGADRVHVSQSAISASIAKLEAEFDVQLLDRLRSPVVPTDAGERLLEAGKAILQICNTVKGELESIARPKMLRIGMPQSFSNRHVSKLLGSFRRINPHVAIEVSDGSYEQLVELLAERQFDAVLTIIDDNATKFESRVLFKEPYVLAAPVDHCFAQREKVTVADLHDEPFIVRHATIGSRTRAMRLSLMASRYELCIEPLKSTEHWLSWRPEWAYPLFRHASGRQP
jgi:DNA-binding transcriptional LysR family regulator